MNQKVPRAGVVIVAGGRGLRLGAPVPKQFLPLADRPVFAHSLALFDALEFVTQLVLVVPAEGGLPAGMERWLEGLSRPARLVPGGRERRQQSVAHGLAALSEPFDVALVHDAARPFPDSAAIARLTRAAADLGGGLLAARSPDTIKLADADGRVERTLDRRQIWLAQTPQALRADLVAHAVEELTHPDAPEYTDEAALLESWGVPVALVESTTGNFKITHGEDLARAEALLAGDQIRA